MEGHVAASRLDCGDERHGDVIGRLLSLTRTDNDENTKQMGWLLLSRVMGKCTIQSFRANQAKLSKKVAEMSRQEPSLPAALYVRQLLIRNPQAGEIHKNTIEKIILKLLDSSLDSRNSKMRSIGVELFGIRYGGSGIQRSLDTLVHVLKGSIVPSGERDRLICCQAFDQSIVRDKFIDLLFDVLVSSVHHANIGDSLPRNQLLDVLGLALKTPAWRASALRSIESICDAARWAIAPLVPRIVSLLVSLMDSPCASLFSCLACICTRFSAASTLHKHLYMAYSSLTHPLHAQPYGNEAADMISSIIENCGYLVKPEILISIQRSVCENALRFVDSAPYCKMIYALLACSHELVPVPVNVARTLVTRSSLSLRSLSHLCDSLVHPRIHDLAHNEVRRRVPIKNESVEEMNVEMANLIESVQKENDEFVPAPVTSDQLEPEEILEENGGEEEFETVTAPVTVSEISDSVQQSPMITSSFVQKVQNKVKRKKEEASIAKKAKAEKKAKVQESASLEKGEASVDDILSFFCPQ